MLDKTTLLISVLERLGKLPVGHCLDLRTFKRDRSVCIHRTDTSTFTVVEKGFHEETWVDVELDAVRRLLKTLMRREFPRSHKVRCYSMPSVEAAHVNRAGYGSGRFGGGGA